MLPPTAPFCVALINCFESMRIPLVQRFRIKHAILFAFVLFVVQQLEHTNLLYSALCSVYILLSCLAFNAAGAILWLHAPMAALVPTAINTLLSASAAIAATLARGWMELTGK